MEQEIFTREHALVEAIKTWADTSFIGDDCAVLPGNQLATTDTLVEGTHFLLGKISWRDLGWKAVAVNLSDVAAMAGRPRYLLVSATLTPRISKAEFQELYLGMVDCAKTYGAQIVGGDLTRGESLVLSVTVLADVHEVGCLLRSGAQAGDAVVVTGDFGASRAGLWLIQEEGENISFEQPIIESAHGSHCLRAHFRPLPRLCESWSLVRRAGSRAALMDASDGLADALAQIARKSRVGMQIDLERLPIHNETRVVAQKAEIDPLDWALYGGEDYELVGCMADASFQGWSRDNPFIKIGTVTDGGSIELKRTLPSGACEINDIDLRRCFEQISL
ncbi:MAG TPA: thiamine-phosphate kinase [Chroococcales cyanobacterium]